MNMLADKLFDIISNKSFNEKQVLNKISRIAVHSKVQSVNKVSPAKNREQITPLMAAAQRGFQTVISYLIEKRGANPNQCDLGRQTALDHAILNNHQDAAVYLAAHTTEYPKDIMHGYTSLHLSAGRNQAKVVQAILAKKPDIINILSKENVSALNLATEYNAYESVKLLIDAGAKLLSESNEGYTAYVTSLIKGYPRIISHFLEHTSASAIECEYTPVPNPLEIIFHAPSNTMKLQTLLAFLEAGAGLDMARIPVQAWDLLKLMKQIRKPDWEFLLVGEQTTETGVKKIFVTNYETLLSYLDSPKYTFKLKQIVRSMQHPAIRNLEHIQKIAQRIGCQTIVEPPMPSSSHSVQVSNQSDPSAKSIARISKIKKLNKNDALVKFKISENLFLENSEMIIRQSQQFLIGLNELPTSNADLTNVLNQYLLKLNKIITFLHNPNLNNKALFENVAKAFPNVFFNMYIMLLSPKFNIHALKILPPFATNLRNVIHDHSRVLKAKAPSFYNILLDTQATTLYEMAYSYLKLGKLDLARTLANESLYLNTKNEAAESKKSRAHCDAHSFVVLAQVDILESRNQSAINNMIRAEQKLKAGLSIPCRDFCETLNSALETNPNIQLKPVINLLRDTVIYLDRIKDVTLHDTFFSVLAEKECGYHQTFSEKLNNLTIQYSSAKALKDKASKPDIPKIAIIEPLTSELSETIQRLETLSLKSSDGSPSSSNTYCPSRVKTKTKGIANPALDTKRRKPSAACSSTESNTSEGFALPEGYITPVPIEGGYLSPNQLFITMPASHPDFAPFYKLIEGGAVRCIAQYGKHQQGIKLGRAEVQVEPGAPREQVPIARLKICAGEEAHIRPWGFIEQTQRDPDGAIRKLYVFRPEGLHNKKEEFRSGYKP